MAINIVLADDHAIFREGLRSMLEKKNDMKIVGEASDGLSAVDLVKKLKPDLVVMDIAMPGINGIDAIESILNYNPKVAVVVLSMYQEERFVSGAFLAGAKGYLLKESLFDELIQAVYAVSVGQFYISPQIAHVAVKYFKGQLPADGALRPASVLTIREREILQLLVEGRSVKDIGEQLCISPKTVEAHRRNLSEKLDIRQPVELIKYALREGIVSFDTWLSPAK